MLIFHRKGGVVFYFFCMNDIESRVQDVRNKVETKYVQHIGGGYFVSVTSGFYCVDIRKFYTKKSTNPDGSKEIRPGRPGIALRLSEWTMMQSLIPKLHEKAPLLRDAIPCSIKNAHFDMFSCNECWPFGDAMFLFEGKILLSEDICG